MNTIKNYNQFVNEKKETPKFSVGDIVRINPEIDNQNYNDFKNKDLVIINVATSEKDHPGYDTSIGGGLYDLETSDGQDVPFSLYDYELIEY